MPDQSDLYIITSIFNPFGFKSRIRLYEQFARHMSESGVKLLTIEAAFGDRPFEATTADNPWNIQLRTNQVLFHKERMINLATSRLGQLRPDWRNMGWFDADVTFANANWAQDATHKLMHHPVIQPFSEAINLNANEEMMWKCPSTFHSFINDRGYHQEPPIEWSYIYKGHPGLAWCATRDALHDLGGLYDTCITGSADTVMANCLKGKWDAYLPGMVPSGMEASIKTWAARCDRSIKGNVGYCRGLLLHHWHGKSGDRGYEKRWSIAAFHKFDPNQDLMTGENGMLRWAGNKPRLEDDIRLSLSNRNEDSTD